ncbi:MAG TPA: hypothetical protein VJ011_11080, partial [Steroidobacteraceae bacterium]|nr:hypothetical protein [Steroidobacteraceae bacterium]
SRIASSSAYRPPNAWARILGALTCAGKLPATLTRSHPHQRSSSALKPASPQLGSPLKSASRNRGSQYSRSHLQPPARLKPVVD